MTILSFISNMLLKPRLNAALTLILFGGWVAVFRTFDHSPVYEVMSAFGSNRTIGFALGAIGAFALATYVYRVSVCRLASRDRYEFCFWLEAWAGLLVTGAFAFIAIPLTWVDYRLTSTPIYWGFCLYSFYSLLDLVGLGRLIHAQTQRAYVGSDCHFDLPGR